MTHRRGARPCHQVCRGHGPSPALPPSRRSQEVTSEPTSAAAGAELGCRTDLGGSRSTSPRCRSGERRCAQPAAARGP